jgi:hypothetical protein
MTVSHARFLLAVVGDRAGTSRTLRLEYWRKLKTAIFDSYRPERHYMRGPGPKCRAKQRAS